MYKPHEVYEQTNGMLYPVLVGHGPDLFQRMVDERSNSTTWEGTLWLILPDGKVYPWSREKIYIQ